MKIVIRLFNELKTKFFTNVLIMFLLCFYIHTYIYIYIYI